MFYALFTRDASISVTPEDVPVWVQETQIKIYLQCVLLTLLVYDARSSSYSISSLNDINPFLSVHDEQGGAKNHNIHGIHAHSESRRLSTSG